MSIKYAYIHPQTREYLYTESRDELKAALAQFAAQTYIDHYCNGQAYTLVSVQEDGSEQWYSPTGDQVMSPAELEAEIQRIQALANVGQIPVTLL